LQQGQVSHHVLAFGALPLDKVQPITIVVLHSVSQLDAAVLLDISHMIIRHGRIEASFHSQLPPRDVRAVVRPHLPHCVLL
jgi:hypothetical protein